MSEKCGKLCRENPDTSDFRLQIFDFSIRNLQSQITTVRLKIE